MPRSEGSSPASIALRKAGFKKAPAWWLTEEQYELFLYVATQNLPEINRIKNNSKDHQDYLEEIWRRK